MGPTVLPGLRVSQRESPVLSLLSVAALVVVFALASWFARVRNDIQSARVRESNALKNAPKALIAVRVGPEDESLFEPGERIVDCWHRRSWSLLDSPPSPNADE